MPQNATFHQGFATFAKLGKHFLKKNVTKHYDSFKGVIYIFAMRYNI